MNWGGIIAGAIGGGAQAVGEIADANLKEQAVERAEKRSLSLNFEKFKQEANYKLQMDRQALERYEGDMLRTRERADQNMRGKDVAVLDALNDRVGGDSPEMSRAEMEQLLKDNPQYRQVYEQAGYMEPRKQSGIVGEQLEASREIGATPELRKDLRQSYTDTLSAEDKAARERRDERRLTETERANMERERLAQERLDAVIAGKGESATGGKDGLRETLTYLDGQRKRIKDGLTELRQTEKADLESVFDQVEKKRIKDQYSERRRVLEEEDRSLSSDYQKVRDRLLGESSDSSSTSRPSPAPSARPGGKPGWQSEQSYSDQVQIILAEYRKATDPETKAALARELTRLGVDPTKQTSDNRGSGPGAIPKINSRDELNALPKGTRYIAPDGTTRIKS